MTIDWTRLRRAAALLVCWLAVMVGGWSAIILSFRQPWFPYALGVLGLASLAWMAWLLAGDWPPPWFRKRDP